VTRNKSYPPRTQAAIFLLTADQQLWRKWRKAITDAGVDWLAGRSSDVGWDGGALEEAARSIALCSAVQITLHELADRNSYSLKLLGLILVALAIARNDLKAPREIYYGKGVPGTC
jgi:hypothetical protein